MTLDLVPCVCGRWHAPGHVCTACPSCDRDLGLPDAPGHECYTYAQHLRGVRRRAYERSQS